jgi:hypothetical protein
VPRHDLDPIALVFGTVFVVVGLAYAVARWNWIGSDRSWLLGAVLIAVGVAGVVSAASRRSRAVDS